MVNDNYNNKREVSTMQFPEDEAIQKLNEQHARVVGAVQRAQEESEKARKNLPALHKQLADVIFQRALGEASEADVNAARFAILYAERAVDAGELISEPARRAEVKINGESRKLSAKRLYRQEYEELKAKIAEHGAASEEDAAKLLDLCLTLNGDHSEAQAVLSALTDEAA